MRGLSVTAKTISRINTAPQPAAAVASEVREVLVRLEAARVEISGALRAKLTAAANEAAAKAQVDAAAYRRTLAA